MKYSKMASRKVLSGLGLAVAISLSACGDLSTLLNNPQVQAAINALQLNLNREIDGTTTAVNAADIQTISANGQKLKYTVNAEGQLTFSDLPADATAIEVQYKDATEPVIMPIQKDQSQNGKLLMRGVSRFSKGQDGKLALQENVAGFDFNQDGQFDDKKPQFVQSEGKIAIHDINNQRIQEFDLKPGQEPNFKLAPNAILEGNKFFLPQPPQRPGTIQKGLPCGKIMAKADGSIDFPRPDGSARNLLKGEFEITPEGGMKIIKAGEPDNNRVIRPPACPRPVMLPPGCENVQPGGPGMQQTGQPGGPATMAIMQIADQDKEQSEMRPEQAEMLRPRCAPPLGQPQPGQPQPGQPQPGQPQ
jgi:hypothetical protein